MRSLPSSVHVVTSVLLLNMAVGLTGGPPWLIGSLLLSTPFLVIWMVVQVLKDGGAQINDLPAGDHWGYQDRPDLRPRH